MIDFKWGREKKGDFLYHMYKKEGSITVFLTILFLLFFALLGVTFENVRVMSSQGYVRVAAHSAAMTTFGNFNRELYEDYGLFAYGGFGGMGIEALESELSEIVNDNLKSTSDNGERCGVDLYRLHNIECIVENTNMLSEPEIFQNQVKAVLKSSLVKDLTQDVIEKVSGKSEYDVIEEKLSMTNEFEEGKYDSEEQNKESSKEKNKVTEKEDDGNQDLSRRKALEKDSAGGNPLEVFSEIARDGVLNLVCDAKNLSDGMVESCNADEDYLSRQKDQDALEQRNQKQQKDTQAADYLQDILGSQDEMPDISGIEKGIEKVELIRYANQMVGSYVKDMGRTTKYGLEYIAEGRKEEKDNLSAIVNRLLKIRTLLNFTYVISDAVLQEKSLATATVLAGFTGLPPVINAVQYTILLILAFQEACVDVTALLEDRSVPFMKNASNFKMKYEEICLGTKSLFSSKAKGYQKIKDNHLSKSISYNQYLWLFLLMNSKDTIQERILDIIQYDLRERYNQTFCVHNCICNSIYSVQYQVLYLFDKLPYLSLKEEWNPGVNSLEVKYGYKSS